MLSALVLKDAKSSPGKWSDRAESLCAALGYVLQWNEHVLPLRHYHHKGCDVIGIANNAGILPSVHSVVDRMMLLSRHYVRRPELCDKLVALTAADKLLAVAFVYDNLLSSRGDSIWLHCLDGVRGPVLDGDCTERLHIVSTAFGEGLHSGLQDWEARALSEVVRDKIGKRGGISVLAGHRPLWDQAMGVSSHTVMERMLSTHSIRCSLCPWEVKVANGEDDYSGYGDIASSKDAAFSDLEAHHIEAHGRTSK